MSDLWADYLALPDVAFMREHWLAVLLMLALCAAISAGVEMWRRR